MWDLYFLVFIIAATLLSSLPSFTPILLSAGFVALRFFSGDFYSTEKKMIINYFGKNEASLPYGRLTYETARMIKNIEHAIAYVFLIEAYRTYQAAHNVNVWDLDWKNFFKQPFQLWRAGFTSYRDIAFSLVKSIFGFKENISRKEVLSFARSLLIPEIIVILLSYFHIKPTFGVKGVDPVTDFGFWIFAIYFNKYLIKSSHGKIGFTDFQLSIFLSSWIGGIIADVFFLFRSMILMNPNKVIVAILASLLSYYPVLAVGCVFIWLIEIVMLGSFADYHTSATDFYFSMVPAKQTLPYLSVQYDPKSVLFYGRLAVYAVVFQNTAAPVIKATWNLVNSLNFSRTFIQMFSVDFTT